MAFLYSAGAKSIGNIFAGVVAFIFVAGFFVFFLIPLTLNTKRIALIIIRINNMLRKVAIYRICLTL